MATEKPTSKVTTEAPPEDRLEPEEVKDTRDVSPRAPAPVTKGKRVRAIPARGGTTVEITRGVFKGKGIDNPTVKWDFRKDNFTVPVGELLSQEAADFLTLEYPQSFEYMSGG